MNVRYAPTATVICFLVSWFIPTEILANPTGEKPNQPLDAHGTIEAAKGMVAGLYKIHDEEEQFTIQLHKVQKTPERYSDKQLGKSSARLWKARRDAEHLKLMGEPAGFDLAMKIDMLSKRVSDSGQLHLRTPPGGQANQRVRVKLQKEMPRLTKFLQSAAAKQGNPEALERLMEAKGIDLYTDLVMIHYTKKGTYNSQFESVLGQVDALLRRKRRLEYTKRASEVIDQQLVAATEFSSEAARIRDEIANSGSAKLGDGKTGDAAEALAHVAKLWGNASTGLLRATAIVWAFSGQTEYDDYEGGGSSGTSESKFKAESDQLKEMALKAMASIIEAAAVSTPAENVPTVYSNLLKQLSIVERRTGSSSDREVSKACESALAKLAAKDSMLSTRIAAYQRGTSEALKWRQQFAGQQARNLAKSFPLASNMMSATSEVTSNVRPSWAPKAGQRVVAPATFSVPANWMVDEAATRLVGKTVSDKNMIRLTPTSRTAVVPFNAHHYGNVPISIPSDAEVADLKTALVSDDTHGPLTFESADAISAAELQDYDTVSGTIKTVHLESPLTRFIGLPDVAYALQPLGRMPQLSGQGAPVRQACWRLDIQPAWAQHRYFTVRKTSETK